MKKANAFRILGFSLALLLMIGLLMPEQAVAKKTRFDKIAEKTPPLRDIQIPPVTRKEMANGMVIYLVEDHDLPLIRFSAMIRAGSMYEPKGKIGLADIVGTVMRSGGTERYPGDDLDLLLENMGAAVETGMRPTNATASMNCLVENLDQVLPVFADVLRAPAFPQDKIDLTKTQTKSVISRRNDDADQIARREIVKLYYGDDSPYARHEEYDTINAIERGDLVAFHEYFFHPDNIIMTVGGDFDTETMYAHLEEVFGDWERGDTFFPPDPVLVETSPSVSYIFKEDVNQSKVVMGHLGVRWDDEYVFPIQVMNKILGGGFGSRLFNEVRSKEELAYSVYAFMIVGNHHRMPFIVGVDTKSETTVKALEIIMRELRKITTEEITDEELTRAKEGLKNAFVFNFSNPFSIARRKASYEFWGRDGNYLDIYLERIEAVTKADVLEAARARIHPEEMAILVVGREEDFDKPLSSLGLGEPEEIDITIPEPSFEEEMIPEATEENLAAGKALIKKAFKAYGGAKALRAAESRQMSGDFIIQETPMGPMTFSVVVYTRGESEIRTETNTPFGSMTQIINGDQGWMSSPQGSQKLGSGEVKDTLDGERQDILWICKHIDELRYQNLGKQDLDGTECNVVHVTGPDDLKLKLYLDPRRNLIKAMEYRDQGQAGPVLNLTIYDEFKASGGWQFSRKVMIHHDGELFAEMLIKDVTVGKQFDDALFAIPEE